MTLTVRSNVGESVVLSDQPVGQGGEAQVYTVPAFPNVAVKIYHPNILAQHGADLRSKIEVMCTDPKLRILQENTALAWPHFSVFGEKGEWIGFAMRPQLIFCAIPPSHISHSLIVIAGSSVVETKFFAVRCLCPICWLRNYSINRYRKSHAALKASVFHWPVCFSER